MEVATKKEFGKITVKLPKPYYEVVMDQYHLNNDIHKRNNEGAVLYQGEFFGEMFVDGLNAMQKQIYHPTVEAPQTEVKEAIKPKEETKEITTAKVTKIEKKPDYIGWFLLFLLALLVGFYLWLRYGKNRT